MIINIRGGLGNQIIQIGHVLKKSKFFHININAVNLRDQVKDIENINYINNRFLNLLFGSLRKSYSFIKSRATDISCCKVYDGYFQYGDITNILQADFKEYLEKQIIIDENIKNEIDIVLHVRGGDYFSNTAKNIYEVCDKNYYKNSLNIAFDKINKDKCHILIVTNDRKYSNTLLNNIISNNHNVMNYYESEWKDFSIISRAKIAIIPNSTFSMVARMLLEDDDKITIAPKKWFTKESKLLAPYNKNFIYN